MRKAAALLEQEDEVLAFLRTQYPIYHQSNVFFRDLQYGIRTMLERRGVRVDYSDAEHLAREFAGRLEKKKMLVRVDDQSWVMKNENFRTEPVKKQAAAKPATKPAAAAPAGGLPPLKSAAPAGVKPAGLPPLKSSAPATGAKPAGLPPLKSSAPATGAKPAGLPPPKSSAPVGGAPAPAAQPKQEAPAAAPAAPKPSAAPKKEPAPAKPAAAGPGGLPPITSSVPAGKK